MVHLNTKNMLGRPGNILFYLFVFFYFEVFIAGSIFAFYSVSRFLCWKIKRIKYLVDNCYHLS